MFAVIFEVQPEPDQWSAYLSLAKSLRPELETIRGFLSNVRYKSLTREGWILSLSLWANEKAVVRWRTKERHHDVQAKGRDEVLKDYHLRVGEVFDSQGRNGGEGKEGAKDSNIEGNRKGEETEVGEGHVVELRDGTRDTEWVKSAAAEEVAASLRMPNTSSNSAGLVSWDVFEAVLTPGDVILLCTWRDDKSGRSVDGDNLSSARKEDTKSRRVRVVRDYGMFDRREAPQYYPDAKGRQTIHGGETAC